jgi:hypothetical protein
MGGYFRGRICAVILWDPDKDFLRYASKETC